MPRETTLFPKITEQGLDDLRRRIGVKITDTLEPWCHEATRDNIRHYAHGIGDDNPLWCDPDYAAKSSHGGIIALPSFLFSTSRIVSGYVGGLLLLSYLGLLLGLSGLWRALAARRVGILASDGLPRWRDTISPSTSRKSVVRARSRPS